MKLKSDWDNKDLLEKCLIVFIILIVIFLVIMKSISALTDEERERNNQLLQDMDEKGEIPVLEIRDYTQDLNPFFIFGVLTIGIIILVVILIRLVNRDRL